MPKHMYKNMIANIHKEFMARFQYMDLGPKAQGLTYLQHGLKDTKEYKHVTNWWLKILDIAQNCTLDSFMCLTIFTP